MNWNCFERVIRIVGGAVKTSWVLIVFALVWSSAMALN